MKRCKKCGEVKPIDEFYRAAGMKDGHRSECKTCHKSRQRQWYQANRVHAIAEVNLRRSFGIGICGRKPGKVSLHVDHDHETGEIRGLLCVGCNNALGQFHDDPGLLTLAADYVSCDVRPFVVELELLDVIPDRARELQDVSG